MLFISPVSELSREIVNGENFLVHGEMTIANDEDNILQNSEKLAVVPRQNPLLSLHRNRLAARVIEENLAQSAEVRVSTQRYTPAVSRRKSFNTKPTKSATQTKPSIIDLSTQQKKSGKSSFVYSPTTYSRARALMETDPPLKVRPSCHYYGTKRMQHQPTSSTVPPSPIKTSKPRPIPQSPLLKRPSSLAEPKPAPHVITIEPDSTSSQTPCKSKSGGKDRAGLTLLDDDVFQYTPTPPTTSSNYEKLVKNEDRYSKYELGKMANDRHKKLFNKTAELNEKLKEIKDLEKKVSRMKGSITKLTNELKEKNRILETQSTELLDLEGSKSDCEIFINKLKEDLEESQKKLEVKSKEFETSHKRSTEAERQLEEQRRLHQNLSLAHSTTLQKIRDMAEERRKTNLLHTAEIQDKDVLIRKLEQGLAQKMETVNQLVKDKRLLEGLLSKARNERATCSTLSANLKSEPVVADLDTSQESLSTVRHKHYIQCNFLSYYTLLPSLKL